VAANHLDDYQLLDLAMGQWPPDEADSGRNRCDRCREGPESLLPLVEVLRLLVRQLGRFIVVPFGLMGCCGPDPQRASLLVASVKKGDPTPLSPLFFHATLRSVCVIPCRLPTRLRSLRPGQGLRIFDDCIGVGKLKQRCVFRKAR